MTHLQIEKKQNYLIVQMNRGKVNAINHEMVKELRQIVQTVENDDGIKGMILAGKPHFFSAGLDVIELFDYDEKTIREFFIAFGSLHVEMVRLTKPLICAITGHSPAGGCVFAITADHRVMVDDAKYSIGLNEVAVNIQISTNLIEAYSFWLGRSKANEFILDGKLLTPQEALEHGLVNQICPLEKVIERTEKKMQQYLRADETIFKNTKKKLRNNWLTNLVTDTNELEEAIKIWWSPEVRMKMEAFVHYLKNRSKSKV